MLLNKQNKSETKERFFCNQIFERLFITSYDFEETESINRLFSSLMYSLYSFSDSPKTIIIFNNRIILRTHILIYGSEL